MANPTSHILPTRLQTFSGDNADWHAWQLHVIAYLRNASTVHFNGGLLGHFFHVHNWRTLCNLPATTIFTPASHPGYYPADPADYNRWKHQEDLYRRDRQELNHALHAIQSALPADALLTAFGSDPTAPHGPIKAMENLASAYGRLTKSQIAATIKAVTDAYDGITPIRRYLG